MNKYFKVEKIKYEGPKTKNELAYRYYDKNKMVLGKPMKDWLRFSMTYWHTFESRGGDPFGPETRTFTWDKQDDKTRTEQKIEAMFEYLDVLDVDFFAFHDRDIAVEEDDINKYFANVEHAVSLIEAQMKKTGKQLLWNTSNLFSHKRYMSGAATSPHFDVFAYAAAQTKNNLDIAKRLGAKGFTFWGGREGYDYLINTKMGQELDQLAALLKMAIAYADKIGFKGQFYIEPKAKEPSTHQYDFDTATVLGFLRKYGLEKKIKVNIEQNHALLAGKTFHHEMVVARENGILGSLDSNEGDPLLGWDTDSFPSDVYVATLAMYEVIKNGGIAPGGLNFDSKLRRQSNSLDDLLYGAILGIDTYAKGLLIAARLIEDKVFDNIVDTRYSTWDKNALAAKVLKGSTDLETVAKYGIEQNIQEIPSSHEERIRTIFNKYMFEVE